MGILVGGMVDGVLLVTMTVTRTLGTRICISLETEV